MKWFIRNILRPKWVIFQTTDGEEYGVMIWGVIISCYKGEMYIVEDYTRPRPPEKRELGESLLVPSKEQLQLQEREIFRRNGWIA